MGPFTIVQIDAHIDWRDEVAGERFGLSSTMRRASEMPHIERIVQVGQRAIGSARPATSPMPRRGARSSCRPARCTRTASRRSLDAVPAGSQVLVTLDCDGLDPTVMPGVIAPAPGGLTYWQAIGILHGIAAKARIAAFDIVEFVPERDVAGLGALTAARIIVNVLGLVARQAGAARE